MGLIISRFRVSVKCLDLFHCFLRFPRFLLTEKQNNQGEATKYLKGKASTGLILASLHSTDVL
jgi:hypothetical protein